VLEDPAKLEGACARLEGWGGGIPLMLRDGGHSALKTRVNALEAASSA
jgi:hypothetical protein